MTQLLKCTIPGCSSSYEIEIDNGLLNKPMPFLSSLGSRFAIITDDKVASLYGEKLRKSLSDSGHKVNLFSFPNGEHNKTRATKEKVEDQLLESKLGRDTCIIALGGGVVTDIAGYIAATYCRGLPLVMIPTSLLGMVDASIGGKNGVNVPHGKNMVGCIYQPKRICIDPLTLKSLSKKELSDGVVESIKHGIIDDSKLFNFLDEHAERLLALDPDVLEKMIFESCRIKKEIVEQDEKEKGKRSLLNFGHTIGHALELLTNYSISHGEAIAIGILVECYLSVELGVLNQESFERIKKVLVKYHLPLRLPSHISAQAMIDAMSLDKKSLKGKPRFVIIEKIGSPSYHDSDCCRTVDESLLNKAIDWMNNDLCRH
jgi:3-dehydroquinate synthase